MNRLIRSPVTEKLSTIQVHMLISRYATEAAKATARILTLAEGLCAVYQMLD